ncbi:MAG: chemotaxis protein CheW [Alphaproteobacteria bacterium]|nr:chemotaxis protein CheW [Alphaproteobacteria bacterium]
MNALTAQPSETGTAMTMADVVQFVTVKVGKQSFGIPVLDVEDIIGPQPVTRVPLSLEVIRGSLNLRGRIVTAVDLRTRLSLPKSDGDHHMNVVVEYKGDLYSLVVDEVGDVLNINGAAIDPHPATMSAKLREVSNGIHKLDGELLVLLDVSEVLTF